MDIPPISSITDPKSSSNQQRNYSLENEDFVPSSESLEAGYFAQKDSLEITASYFSLTASGETSFEANGQLYNLQYEVQYTSLSLGIYHSSEDGETILDMLPDDVRDKVEDYLDEDSFPDALSPENVSQRIVDFALQGFDPSTNDSYQARENFVNYITPAIDQGIDEALEILSPFLTDDVRDLVQETRDLIYEKLDLFKGMDVAA